MSQEFQNAVDAVSKRAGVSAEAVKHNPSNQILLDGCRKMGYHADTIPQNTAGKEHACGWCTFGCPYAEKQGTMETWIKDAAAAGSRFIQGAWVERIIHRNGVAEGVWAKVEGGYNLSITAKRVVVSCGSIGTPGLLLRSGLKNRNIGRHLRLHPVTTVSGIFPGQPIKPFQGSIMTVISNEVANRQESHYGARLEVPAIHPSMLATLLPWTSASEHKRLMSQFEHTATFIVLTRDRDSKGRVYIDGEGQSRIDWSLSKFDSESLLQGLEAGIRVMIAAGAQGMSVSIFNSWLQKSLLCSRVYPHSKFHKQPIQWKHRNSNRTSIRFVPRVSKHSTHLSFVRIKWAVVAWVLPQQKVPLILLENLGKSRIFMLLTRPCSPLPVA